MYPRQIKCIQNTTGATSRKASALKTGGGVGDYRPNHDIKMDINEAFEDER